MMVHFLQRRPKRPLRPLESKLIDVLAAQLTAPARDVLTRQLELVNLVQRHGNDKEVNLYQMRHGRPTSDGMPMFPLAVPEVKLATIAYSVPGQSRASQVDFWLVGGHLFSMQFSQSPRRLNADQIEIRDVKLLTDPMVPAEIAERRPLDPAVLTGWLAEWAGQWQVSDLREPLSAQERVEKLRQIDATLPSDYLDLLPQTEGLQINGCRVYGLLDIREVVLPDATYYVIAEMEDRGVLAVKQGQSDGALCFFAYERDGSPVGSSLRAAVEKLLRDELS